MIKILQLGAFFLFNLILELVYILFRPLLILILARISYRESLSAQGPDIKGGVLFHAASLGEVNAARSLILQLCNHLSPSRIAVTTTTVNGLKAARAIHPEIVARLSVLDVYSARKKQLAAISPGLICIIETEIWPNLLYCAKRKGIPVLFLNARLSLTTTKRMRYVKPLLGYIGSSIKEIMAKSNDDAARFENIFDAPVTNAGNLKFALCPPAYNVASIRKDWGFGENDLLICVGSTRPGEETLLLKAFITLKKEYSNLKLILAPRHPSRIGEVKRLCALTGFRLLSTAESDQGQQNVMIIDKLGHLNEAYSICDIAVVGGSFYDFGGHNPLEPAFYGKPILIGPYHSSCLESVHELANNDAIRVCDKSSLYQESLNLLNDPLRRQAMGSRAKQVINRSQTSLNKHLDGVLRWIS